MESGRFIHRVKSSSIVFNSGMKLRLNKSVRFWDMFIPKYVILFIVNGVSCILVSCGFMFNGKIVDLVQFME